MELIMEVAASQFVWAILAIALAALVIREQRKENVKREEDLIKLYDRQVCDSRDREQQLLKHLDRTNKAHQETTETLKQIRNTLNQMEGRIDRMEKYYFKDTQRG
ncbi:hypothetical protein [Oceanobacillus oncorhynchi]|uniref:hypothetical protein n=1 Tax=Oceanobacillus oncorhynchi TaxID=545501 RepID=UPI0021168B3F|nr:hypothetical protein [Oceanobacillus oncorhynchi]UUI41193.1 hypothetical protein NP440_06400 [Oceanobacillus oncorhynchi]